MSLDRAINKTIPQKIKLLILGKERPNFLTRVSVIAGFFIWLYLFSWHLLTFLALILMTGIKPGWRQTVEGSFYRVGSKLYGYDDSVNRLFVHSIAQFAVYAIVIIGLLLIWRKKKIGFLLYVIGNVGALFVTLFIMGADYLTEEISLLDFSLIGITTIYFGIGALWFYKWKGRKKGDSNKQEPKTNTIQKVQPSA